MSLTVKLAERDVFDVGLNATPIEQLLPAVSELGQAAAFTRKSPALVPVAKILVMARAVAPGFFRVTVLVALVVPTVWFPKLRLFVLKVA